MAMPEEGVSVPLREDMLHRLRLIETHARVIGDGLSAATVVSQAIRAFLPPLVALADRNESLDLPPLPPDHDKADVAYVRLDRELAVDLDRVVAYAATIGREDVTRSGLVSAAVRAFLAGFDAELANGC